MPKFSVVLFNDDSDELAEGVVSVEGPGEYKVHVEVRDAAGKKVDDCTFDVTVEDDESEDDEGEDDEDDESDDE